MSSVMEPRAHLVERAVEALGGLNPRADRTVPRPEATPPTVVPLQGHEPAPATVIPPAVTLEVLHAAGLAAPDTSFRVRVLEEMEVAAHGVIRAMTEAASRDEPRTRVVLVTSALRGEGKSFTALNLAARLAGAGRNVTLADVDGRQGGLSHLIGAAERPGLRQLALDPAMHAGGLPIRTEVSRLFLMPYGAGPPPGRDAPSAAAIASAITRLAAALRDHVIVLDSPPSLATSDPSALASVAGQVVLVVDAERTERSEVEAALDMLDACPTLQLILNRVRFSATDTFGAYGDYGAQDAS